MSLNQPANKRLSLCGSLAVGLTLCGTLLTQAGCSFNSCGLWPFAKGTTCCSNCEGNIEANQTVSYTYQDGLDVGRQYAINYDVDQRVDSYEPLPTELQAANLGQSFEFGCREGINSVVDARQQPSLQEPAQAQDGMVSDQWTIEQSASPGQDSLILESESTESTAGGNKSDANSLPDLPTDTESAPDLQPGLIIDKSSESIFNESQLRHPKPMTKSQPGNLINNKNGLPESAEQQEEDFEVTQSNDPNEQALAEELFAQSQPMSPAIRPESETLRLQARPISEQTKTEQTKTEQNKTNATPSDEIVLSASPVGPNSDTEEADSSRSSQITKARSKVHENEVLKLTAIPMYNIEYHESSRKMGTTLETQDVSQPASQSTPETSANQTTADQTSKKKQEISVLVDHLDGVAIELDPIPTLRATTSHPSASPHFNAGHRILQQPSNTAAEQTTIPANETTIPANEATIQPINPQPANCAPGDHSQPTTGNETQLTTPIAEPNAAPSTMPAKSVSPPVTKPAGYRLPAIGPNLEEMLKSPFDKDDTAPNSSEFEPRQAEPDNGNLYR